MSLRYYEKIKIIKEEKVEDTRNPYSLSFAILYFLRQQYINLANEFVTTKLD